MGVGRKHSAAGQVASHFNEYFRNSSFERRVLLLEFDPTILRFFSLEQYKVTC